MGKFFEQLYYKKLGKKEMRPKDEEYEKAYDEFDKVYEKVENALPEDQKKLLDELFQRGVEVTAVLEYFSYKEGFRAGLLLGIEMSEESSWE